MVAIGAIGMLLFGASLILLLVALLKKSAGLKSKAVKGLGIGFVMFIGAAILMDKPEKQQAQIQNPPAQVQSKDAERPATSDKVPAPSELKQKSEQGKNDNSQKKSILKQMLDKQQGSETKSDVPREYRMALRAAEDYLNTMPFSKEGLYKQLTSEYGSKFPAEAARYAVDNVKTDWNKNALQAAKDYLKVMPMSNAALHDQLTSQAGDQYTKEQADYAISHLPK